MCKNIAISLLVLFSNNLNNFLTSDSVDSIYIRIKNLKSGYDERYDINNPEYNYNERINVTLLGNIRKHIINKNIVEELENNNTSIHKKLDIIEKYLELYMNEKQISGFNLLAGNLLKDFYDI
jgi:hypothetical protein